MMPHEMFSAEAWQVFYKTLGVMTSGMFGVFVFMAIFSAIILGLDKFFPHEQKDYEESR